MPSSDTYFKPGNVAGKALKEKPKRRNLIKRKLENLLIWEEAEEQIERNIMEFLTSPKEKTRLLATKYFAEFVKPKKREQTGETREHVEVKIIYDENDLKDRIEGRKNQ